MATLSDDNTESEERELADTFDKVAINISEVSSLTLEEEEEQIFSHLAYMDEKDASAVFVARIHDNFTKHAMT